MYVSTLTQTLKTVVFAGMSAAMERPARLESATYVHLDKQTVLVPVSTLRTTPTIVVPVVPSAPMEKLVMLVRANAQAT